MTRLPSPTDRFDYTLSDATYRTLLDKVRLCDASDVCTWAKKFEWNTFTDQGGLGQINKDRPNGRFSSSEGVTDYQGLETTVLLPSLDRQVPLTEIYDKRSARRRSGVATS